MFDATQSLELRRIDQSHHQLAFVGIGLQPNDVVNWIAIDAFSHYNDLITDKSTQGNTSNGISSLCNLCVLWVSVVVVSDIPITTATQRTQRLHREESHIATHVPRFKNCPSPAFPLNSPLSTTTLPRDSTVSTTPLIFFPSYAL